MKNILFSLFAIALAGVAAIAATTAMLNTPVHSIGPPPADKKTEGTATPTPGTPAPVPSGDRPATPAPIPDADKPVGGASKPAEPTGGAKPAEGGATAPAGANPDDDKEDKDPYEGIAPEDLPPDLQYDADSSVSFPTNT